MWQNTYTCCRQNNLRFSAWVLLSSVHSLKCRVFLTRLHLCRKIWGFPSKVLTTFLFLLPVKYRINDNRYLCKDWYQEYTCLAWYRSNTIELIFINFFLYCHFINQLNFSSFFFFLFRFNLSTSNYTGTHKFRRLDFRVIKLNIKIF